MAWAFFDAVGLSLSQNLGLGIGVWGSDFGVELDVHVPPVKSWIPSTVGTEDFAHGMYAILSLPERCNIGDYRGVPGQNIPNP